MNVSQMLELMSDEYILRILDITQNRPLTISEISRDLGIPIASCYRRIEDLLNGNMIIVRDHITDRGRHTKGYRSTIKRMDIRYTVGDIRIEITDIDGGRRSLITDLNLEISRETTGTLPDRTPILTIPDYPTLLAPEVADSIFKPEIQNWGDHIIERMK